MPTQEIHTLNAAVQYQLPLNIIDDNYRKTINFIIVIKIKILFFYVDNVPPPLDRGAVPNIPLGNNVVEPTTLNPDAFLFDQKKEKIN